jgi:hypothetical protein
MVHSRFSRHIETNKERTNEMLPKPGDECPLCTDELINRKLGKLNCGLGVAHYFHYECIEPIHRSGDNRCPLCKAPIKNIEVVHFSSNEFGKSKKFTLRILDKLTKQLLKF